MDLQTYLNNAVAAQRKETLARSDQLTLGELILKIEPIAARQESTIKTYAHEAMVQYDFENLFPTLIDSWRGSYCELALNFKTEGEKLTVTAFLQMLKDTIGKTLEGYKGGDFLMSKHTPVWVANYGNSGNTAVIEVIDEEHTVIIVTGYRTL